MEKEIVIQQGNTYVYRYHHFDISFGIGQGFSNFRVP